MSEGIGRLMAQCLSGIGNDEQNFFITNSDVVGLVLGFKAWQVRPRPGFCMTSFLQTTSKTKGIEVDTKEYREGKQ